jgi:hypothetical protein
MDRARFLARPGEEKARNSDAAKGILEEITGDRRIKARLTEADVDEALSVLKALG